MDKLLSSLLVVLGIAFMFALAVALMPYELAEPAEIEEIPVEIGIAIAALEKVKCEFGKPITIIVSVVHYYDDYDELNLDHMTFTGDDSEVWGWSDCEWQPKHNYAACDLYTVLPRLVPDQAAFHTIGHEVFHGSCGSFHE